MAFGALLNQAEGTTASGTSHTTASFGFTPTSGSLLLIGVTDQAGSTSHSAHSSGWNEISDNEGATRAFTGGWYYKISDGTESTFSLTTSTTAICQWKIVEVEGPWSTSAVDVSTENEALCATAGTTSVSTNTTGTASISDGFAIAWFASDSSNFWDAAKSYTNSFANLGTMYDPGSTPGQWFAFKQLSSSAGAETTVSVTDTGDDVYAAIAIFKPAAGSSAPTLSDLKAVSITASSVQGTFDFAF